MEKISDIFRGDVIRSYEKGKGLGATLRHLKRKKRCEQISTIGILRFAIKALQGEGVLFSKKEIRYHFNSFVDKDDYEENLKGEIFKDLYDP